LGAIVAKGRPLRALLVLAGCLLTLTSLDGVYKALG